MGIIFGARDTKNGYMWQFYKNTDGTVSVKPHSLVAGAFGAYSDYTKVVAVEDIENIVSCIKKHPDAMLLTTEKDAVKLRRSRRVPDLIRERLFYQPVKVEFLEGSDEDFFETLKNDLLGKVHLGDLTIGGNKENNK